MVSLRMKLYLSVCVFCLLPLGVFAQVTNPLQDHVGVTADVPIGSQPSPTSGGNTGGNTSGSIIQFFLFQCSDGIDNDHDGFIDFGSDPDCTSNFGTSEGLPSIFVGPFPTPIVQPALPQYTDNVFPGITSVSLPTPNTPQTSGGGVIEGTNSITDTNKPTTNQPTPSGPIVTDNGITLVEHTGACLFVWLFVLLQAIYVFPLFRKDTWFGYYGIRRALPNVPVWSQNLEWGPFSAYFVIGVGIFAVYLPLAVHLYVLCTIPLFIITALVSVVAYIFYSTRKSA